MANAPFPSVLRRLCGPVCDRAPGGQSDGELLDAFLAGGQEAFAALVGRHGPMVWGVCRRVVEGADAEDVFQATFLVLARCADSIRKRASLASWLHGVARRLACRARADLARRRDREQRAARRDVAGPAAEAACRELHAVLDEELARLPEAYRAALVLCYLEDLTHDEAARRLDCPAGTVKSRLSRGRELLRGRLARRGITLPLATLSLLLAAVAGPARVPAALLRRTGLVAKPGAAAGASARLAGESLRAGPAGIAKALATVLLAAALVSAAALAVRPPDAKPADRPAPGHKAERPAVDPHGDPLPEGALLRLGTVRFRHANGIQAAVLSPDGTTLATAGHDFVAVWDAATGRRRHTFRVPTPRGFGDPRSFLAFSPDGRLLACADVYRVWEVKTGREVWRLPVGATPRRPVGAPPVQGFVDTASSVAFTPDGKRLATSDSSGRVRLWDLAARKEVGQLRGGSLAVFSPDGRTVAFASPVPPGKKGGNPVTLCQADSGKELRRLQPEKIVCRAAFAPDGKTLATTAREAAHLWDVATGRLLHTLAHPKGDGQLGYVSAVAFAPDGKLLATGSDDNLVRLWAPATGRLLRTLRGHRWWVTGLAFAPGGKTLYSASWDSTVRAWDVASGKERPAAPGYDHHVRVAVSPDGTLLACAGTGGVIDLWEAATGRVRHTLRGHGTGNVVFAFVPDGQSVVSAGKDRALRRWDVATGREAGPAREAAPPKLGPVSALAVSPDGKLLASASDAGGRANRGVRVCDFATGKELHYLAQPDTTSLCFSPDGRAMATGGWDGSVRVWDLATGRARHTIPVRDEGRANLVVDAVTFSPDGRLLASGQRDGTIRLWDPATGRELRRLSGHQGPEEPGGGAVVWSVAFSPCGRLVVSGGLDGTVRLWEVASGKEVHRLLGHEGWVLTVAFGADARTVVSGSLDTTGLVWSTRPAVRPFAEGDADRAWEALAGEAAAGYRAACSLVASPEKGVALLRERLRPEQVVSGERLKKLLADLDSDQFAVRRAASRELARLGRAAEPALRAALRRAGSLEARRRLEELLEALPREDSPEALRRSRALLALELLGTTEAREVLTTLAKGTPGTPTAEGARTALERLRKRAAKAPDTGSR